MFNFIKVSLEHIDKIISLRLALLKELGELNSIQEEQLMATSTREYLQKALLNNEFISYMAETNGEPLSISGMVLFKRPPYLENLQGIEASFLICTLFLNIVERVWKKSYLKIVLMKVKKVE
jgi:hypothetical protein